MVGKGGVTENVLSEAARQLEARELVKGRVLEAALLSAREVCDALCEALGADGVQCVGSKFVIYRRSEKKAQEAADGRHSILTERFFIKGHQVVHCGDLMAPLGEPGGKDHVLLGLRNRLAVQNLHFNSVDWYVPPLQ